MTRAGNRILASLEESVTEAALPPTVLARLDHALRLADGWRDPWGLDPTTLKALVATTRHLYATYFRVQCVGLDRLPAGRVMIVANHSGQLPFDALMLILALILDAEPPRIGRAMVDRLVPKLPVIGGLFRRAGEVLGSRETCAAMLAADQCVLVFPEGTRGLGKPYARRYQLQPCGTGFIRMALATATPIVPVGIIGAEGIYPSLGSCDKLAERLGLPYFPVTPFFPWLGPLGMLPLPCQMTLRFGAPMLLQGDARTDDASLQPLTQAVLAEIATLIAAGRRSRADAGGRPSPAQTPPGPSRPRRRTPKDPARQGERT